MTENALQIQALNGTNSEIQTMRTVNTFIRKFELQDFIFTRQVTVDENAIPHSHPILTLNCRHNENPERLLLCFLHEQFHWYASSKRDSAMLAIEDLKSEFLNFSSNISGEEDAFSSYLHLIINWLELQAGKQFLGKKLAYDLISKMDVYPKIYLEVIQSESTIEKILKRHGLTHLF